MLRLVHLFSYWFVTGQSILFISIWKVDKLINIDWKAKLDSGRTDGEGLISIAI